MSLSRLMAEDVTRRMKSHAGGTVTSTADQKTLDDALSSLTKYIPTEVLTLYLPALAVASALGEQHGAADQEILYWVFGLAVNPLMAFAVTLRKRPWPTKSFGLAATSFLYGRFSSTIAFLAWSLVIPGNPYIDRPILSVVSGFCALLASTALSLVEPFFVEHT